MPLLVKWQFQYTILINWQFFMVIKLRFWCSVQPNRNLIQVHCFLFTSRPKGRTLWFINMVDPLKKWVPHKCTPKSGSIFWWFVYKGYSEGDGLW